MADASRPPGVTAKGLTAPVAGSTAAALLRVAPLTMVKMPVRYTVSAVAATP